MAHGSRAASPSLLGCTPVSRSARLRNEGMDWVGTGRSRRVHGNESDSDEPPDGLRQGRSWREAFKGEGETAAKRARLSSDLEPILIEDDRRERKALKKDKKRSLREGLNSTSKPKGRALGLSEGNRSVTMLGEVFHSATEKNAKWVKKDTIGWRSKFLFKHRTGQDTEDWRPLLSRHFFHKASANHWRLEEREGSSRRSGCWDAGCAHASAGERQTGST